MVVATDQSLQGKWLWPVAPVCCFYILLRGEWRAMMPSRLSRRCRQPIEAERIPSHDAVPLLRRHLRDELLRRVEPAAVVARAQRDWPVASPEQALRAEAVDQM